MLKLLLSATLTFSAGTYAIASESEAELVQKSKLLIAYFDCATYANKAMPTKLEKLFQKGMDVGRAFYEGLFNGRISSESLYSEVPWILTMQEGPSVDFILGSVWATQIDSAYREVEREFSCGAWSTEGPYKNPCSDTLRQSHYEFLYREQNCDLLP